MLHWEWLESSYNGRYGDKKIVCSSHGRDVAQILGIVFHGLYHIQAKLEKVDWANERAIEIKMGYANMSTWDYNNLTKLVVLCHDACIRLEIEPHTFNSMRFWFHRREGREGDISRSHPTIETAIENIRKAEGPKLEDRINIENLKNIKKD